MLKQTILVTFLLAILSLFIAEQATDFKGHQVFRIHLKTEEQLKVLRQLEEQQKVDIWTDHVGLHEVDVRVAPEHKKELFDYLLNKLKVPFEVFINDIQSLMDREIENINQFEQYDPKKESTENDFFKKYRNFDEVIAWVKDKAQKYDIATLFNAGKSYEGRDLIGLKIEGENKKRKPSIFYMGTIHSREWVSTTTINYFIHTLLTKYDKDEKIKKMVDNIAWYLLPISNPDGFAYTWTRGGRLWRKTRRPNRNSRCVGTDPNRNWGYKWASGGSSNNPCSQIYHGDSAFSEHNTKAIKEYIEKNVDNLKIFVDYHAYSQLFMRPWGWTKSPPKDEAKMKKVGDAAAKAISALYGKRYRSGRIAKIIYVASGSTSDWAYGEHGVTSYALELRDTGKHGFLLPPEQIIPTAEENFEGVKVMAEDVMSN